MAHILVIDPDPEVQWVLADVLALEGHTVDTAAVVSHARTLLARRHPDLILRDLREPGRSGLALIRPGEDQAAGAANGDGAHAQAVLPKPFTLQELLVAVTQHSART